MVAIDWTGPFDPDPEPTCPPARQRYRPVYRPIKPTHGPVHTLDRETYLARKAELERQYVLFPQSRLENIDPNCCIPLVLE